jgi:hypothetical protein
LVNGVAGEAAAEDDDDEACDGGAALVCLLLGVLSAASRFESPLPLLSGVEEPEGTGEEELVEESFFLDDVLESFVRDNCKNQRMVSTCSPQSSENGGFVAKKAHIHPLSA